MFLSSLDSVVTGRRQEFSKSAHLWEIVQIWELGSNKLTSKKSLTVWYKDTPKLLASQVLGYNKLSFMVLEDASKLLEDPSTQEVIGP